MPRQARIKSESGIYHIMLRGINQQQIFEETEDYCKFLDISHRTVLCAILILFILMDFGANWGMVSLMYFLIFFGETQKRIQQQCSNVQQYCFEVTK